MNITQLFVFFRSTWLSTAAVLSGSPVHFLRITCIQGFTFLRSFLACAIPLLRLSECSAKLSVRDRSPNSSSSGQVPTSISIHSRATDQASSIVTVVALYSKSSSANAYQAWTDQLSARSILLISSHQGPMSRSSDHASIRVYQRQCHELYEARKRLESPDFTCVCTCIIMRRSMSEFSPLFSPLGKSGMSSHSDFELSGRARDGQMTFVCSESESSV